jgi:hypothetical protein
MLEEEESDDPVPIQNDVESAPESLTPEDLANAAAAAVGKTAAKWKKFHNSDITDTASTLAITFKNVNQCSECFKSVTTNRLSEMHVNMLLEDCNTEEEKVYPSEEFVNIIDEMMTCAIKYLGEAGHQTNISKCCTQELGEHFANNNFGCPEHRGIYQALLIKFLSVICILSFIKGKVTSWKEDKIGENLDAAIETDN